MPGINVTVRDGRAGRDPSKNTPEGGEVLMQFESDRPMDVGARLHLPDGTEVEVIGGNETINSEGMIQTVFIGSVWS